MLLLCGIISLWLVLNHIIHFEYPDYFWRANPDIQTYVGINVVSKWSDFSFFTYITMILFGIWCILIAISKLFNLEKINSRLVSMLYFRWLHIHYCALYYFSIIIGRFRPLFYNKATGLAQFCHKYTRTLSLYCNTNYIY